MNFQILLSSYPYFSNMRPEGPILLHVK